MNEQESTALMPEKDGIPDPLPGEDTPQPAAPAPEPETEAAEAETGAVLRRELEEARSRLTQLERERELLRQGVPEEDLDYYVFRIGKLVTDEKDFRTAAGEYLKQNRTKHGAGLSTGASLMGRASRPQTVNDVMNKLLRGE